MMWFRPNRSASLLTVVVCCAGLLPAGPGAAVGFDEGVRVAELSPRAEKAIDNALEYFARTQRPNGSWGGAHQPATTAVTLMAFMLKGHFPKQGRYGEILDKAVEYLVKRSRGGSGYFGGNMYQHALATLALSEVWGMSEREEVRDALKTGVDVILRAQAPSGGWRYTPYPRDADISVTVMQVVALHSAKEAGMYVPKRTIDRAVAYVKGLQVPFTGGFGYTSASGEGFARTAAGVTSLLMCGVPRKSREVQAGLGYMFRYSDSKFRETNSYFYAHYYAVQAVYQAGESYYQRWYPKIHDALLDRQRRDGSFGSPFDSALAVLVLGVPYRYLPVYQR